MPPKRSRGGNRRALPVVVAVVIGLAIGGGMYWYQHPDLEMRLPQDPVGWIAKQLSRERAAESFTVITATSTPSASRETPDEREARARLETEARVSEIEQEVHVGINVERARKGGSPLRWDQQLAAVARAHSDDMTNQGYFSHDTPEGLGPSDRIDRAGYSCWKSTHYGVAENIAIETAVRDPDRTAAEAVRGWVNSPGHRANLLGKQYDRTGVGASFGTWHGYEAVYLTQVFC